MVKQFLFWNYVVRRPKKPIMQIGSQSWMGTYINTYNKANAIFLEKIIIEVVSLFYYTLPVIMGNKICVKNY